jgi:hypothetical protein
LRTGESAGSTTKTSLCGSTIGRDLVELGTASLNPLTNKPYMPKEQLLNICNFDKTCLSLDDSNLNRRGRPEMVLYDPRFFLVGKATSKSALMSTMIMGSTAAGEALPPHLQFQTKVKMTDTNVPTI